MVTQTQNGQIANYNATQPSLSDGAPSALNVDINGNLKVTAITSPGNAQAVSDSLSGDTAGTITTSTGTVTATNLDGFSTVTFSLSGTYVGLYAAFEQSDDGGVTWYSVDAARIGSGVIENSCSNLTNLNVMYRANVSGSDSFRVRATALTSGTVNVLISVTGIPTSAGTATVATFTDVRPASGTITARDIASTSTTGLNSVNLITGNPTANSTFSQTVNGTAGFYLLITGTWTGTLSIEKSIDGGTTWVSSTMHQDGSSYTLASTTANCSLRGTDAGATNVRVRATAAWTGTANILFTFASADTVVTVTAPVRLWDNVSGSTGTIKAASTAALATDTSLVVALTPASAASASVPLVGTALNTYSVHLTSNATTTPTSSTAYISSIAISSEVSGTTSTVTIQDKSGTPLKLVNGFSTTTLTTTPTIVNFSTPVKMVSGIDIITAGAVAATIDVWINYFQ